MPSVRAMLAALLGWFAIGPAMCRAQMEPRSLAPGVFLVAPREPADGNFAETVIVLLRHDETGTLGLVINRPTRASIAQVFADMKRARKMDDPAFSGGPVEEDAVLALLRSPKKIEGASLLFGGIYLINTRGALDRALRSRPASRDFRVYLGYTGWGPGQLEHEMELGVWRVLPGDSESIFAADPTAVWERLIVRTELKYAELFGARSAAGRLSAGWRIGQLRPAD